jgi:hypothetical protein
VADLANVCVRLVPHSELVYPWSVALKIAIAVRQIIMEGEGGACHPAVRPLAAGDSRPRSRRGPGVKPFTPDPSGPSTSDPLRHKG